MAMKKRFYSVNGQMMACESGGVKKDFITDHLGSITAEMDQSQTRTYDARYSAYGKSLWSTGSNSGFGWVGSYGYRETGLSHMSHYVRARHYSNVTGSWSTVDPLWPMQLQYVYVQGRAVFGIDSTGKNWDDCPKPNHFEDGFRQLKKDMAKFCQYPRVPGTPLYDCYKSCGEPTPAANAECLCKHATGVYDTSFGCYNDTGASGACFEGLSGLGGYCMGTLPGGRFTPCRIRICPKNCDAAGVDWADYEKAILHEMMHCCGSEHRDRPERKQFDCIENCIRRNLGWSTRDNGWKGWPKPVLPRDVKCTFK